MQNGSATNAQSTASDDRQPQTQTRDEESPPSTATCTIHSTSDDSQIAICGAGIVGLVLALALHKQTGIKAVLYEQAPAFHDGVGAAIGMYPNGLRVIRDISPELLNAIRDAGCPYEYRRWMRHDGTEVAVASEQALARRDDGLHSVGIRRWKLQRTLYDAVVEAGIQVNFGKRVDNVRIRPEDSHVEIKFDDGSKATCRVLLGADGARSRVREFVASATSSSSKLKYTGTTCLFGLASWPRPERGICFPTASTTKCHACFFPINDREQCFQFHFPVDEKETNMATWGVLGQEEGKDECKKLARRLRDEGWDDEFCSPLENVSHVVRFGFSLLQPRLNNWAHGPVILLGDAAHPPVPYLGQGAQMGLEDAGTLAQLVGRICVDESGSFDLRNFHRASRAFETMRMRRTGMILKYSQIAGREQLRRATYKPYNLAREAVIRLQVAQHGTLPLLLPGVQYDYKEDVANLLLQVKIRQQPSMFRFRYAPAYHSQEMYHVPAHGVGVLSPEKCHQIWSKEPRPQLMTKISEVSLESSSIAGDEEDRQKKKGGYRSRVGRVARPFRVLLHPSSPALLPSKQGQKTN